ncbi:hypothetical protein AB1I63_05335 [Streptococcus pneumoniae]
MKSQEVREVAEDALVEVFLDKIITAGSDWIKEQGLSVLSTTMLDSGLSLIPALGNAISSYKTNRAIKNLEIQIKQLQEHSEALQRNLNIMSVEVKRDLDKLFLYMLEKTVTEKQQEKIQYFTNAFLNLSSHTKIDVDISYIYFDILEQLTYLDIQVLVDMSKSSFYYYQHPEEEPDKTISPEQYRAIRSNLYRLGLAENNLDKELREDLEAVRDPLSELREAVIELQTVFLKPTSKPKIRSLKSRSQAKVQKLKSKDKVKISSFGREMIEFFTEQEVTNETPI